MKKFLTLPLAALLLSFVAFAQTNGTPGTNGTTTLSADLSPANLVPPIEGGTESGQVQVEITMVQGGTTGSNSAVITYDVTLENVAAADITGFSINSGAAGLNGPALVQTQLGTGAEEPPTGNTLSGQVTISNSTQLSSLQKVLDNPANYYVVLSTSINPAGFLRGQLQAGDNGGEMDTLNTKVDNIQQQLNLIQMMIRRVGLSVGVPPDELPSPQESGTDTGSTGTGSTGGTTTTP